MSPAVALPMPVAPPRRSRRWRRRLRRLGPLKTASLAGQAATQPGPDPSEPAAGPGDSGGDGPGAAL